MGKLEFAGESEKVNVKPRRILSCWSGVHSGADGKSVKSCYFCTATSFGPRSGFGGGGLEVAV